MIQHAISVSVNRRWKGHVHSEGVDFTITTARRYGKAVCAQVGGGGGWGGGGGGGGGGVQILPNERAITTAHHYGKAMCTQRIQTLPSQCAITIVMERPCALRGSRLYPMSVP